MPADFQIHFCFWPQGYPLLVEELGYELKKLLYFGQHFFVMLFAVLPETELSLFSASGPDVPQKPSLLG